MLNYKIKDSEKQGKIIYNEMRAHDDGHVGFGGLR